MNFSDLINENLVVLNVESNTKSEVLKEISKVLVFENRISDHEVFIEALMQRELHGSTGIGYGVAIPHGKSDSVITPSLVFGKSEKGVEFDSLDGEPAHIFFMIAVPSESNNLHLQILAKLSRKLMYEEFRNKLKNAQTSAEVLNVLYSIDEEVN